MIRQANITDLDSILTMSKNFVSEVELLMGYNDKDCAESFQALLDSPTSCFLISENSKAMLVGTISPWMCNRNSRIAVELAWYVSPSERKTNVGTEMIKAFEQWAVENKCSFVSMGSLKSSKMEILSKFYERCGYQLHENTYVKVL